MLQNLSTLLSIVSESLLTILFIVPDLNNSYSLLHVRGEGGGEGGQGEGECSIGEGGRIGREAG